MLLVRSPGAFRLDITSLQGRSLLVLRGRDELTYEIPCAEFGAGIRVAALRTGRAVHTRLIALNGLARMLAGCKATGRLDLCDGQVACVLLNGDAGPAAAVWNLSSSLSLGVPGTRGIRACDMLGNPMGEEAAAGRETDRLRVSLEQGRPVYLVGKGLSAMDFEGLLRQSEASPLGGATPVEVTARKAPDGQLEVRLVNTSDGSLDVRARVACPELFGVPPEAAQVVDLAPRAAHSVLLTPDKQPAGGTKAEVTLTIEVGEHGIREHVTKVSVPF
jgi:hypothetical protein